MLKTADTGLLFRPPENVVSDFSDLPVSQNYKEVKDLLEKITG